MGSLRLATVLAVVAFSGSTAYGQTHCLTFEGVFNTTVGAAHPTIFEGNTFRCVIQFDDSDTIGEGTHQLVVRSAWLAEFQVNDAPHPTPTTDVCLWLTYWASTNELIFYFSGSGLDQLNKLSMSSSHLDPANLAGMGSTMEFADLLLLDDTYVTNSFFVHGNAHPLGYIYATNNGASVGADSCGDAQFIRGDVSGDGSVSLQDVVCVLNHLFQSHPVECGDAADANDDSAVNLADAIFLLNHTFLQSPTALPMPATACGTDPSYDSLDCQQPAACP